VLPAAALSKATLPVNSMLLPQVEQKIIVWEEEELKMTGAAKDHEEEVDVLVQAPETVQEPPPAAVKAMTLVGFTVPLTTTVPVPNLITDAPLPVPPSTAAIEPAVTFRLLVVKSIAAVPVPILQPNAPDTLMLCVTKEPQNVPELFAVPKSMLGHVKNCPVSNELRVMHEAEESKA
jgi:hypothetical protein